MCHENEFIKKAKKIEKIRAENRLSYREALLKVKEMENFGREGEIRSFQQSTPAPESERQQSFNLSEQREPSTSKIPRQTQTPTMKSVGTQTATFTEPNQKIDDPNTNRMLCLKMIYIVTKLINLFPQDLPQKQVQVTNIIREVLDPNISPEEVQRYMTSNSSQREGEMAQDSEAKNTKSNTNDN